ncbi:MAG: undecaprenyl/decaprenyl-phosphate alpha-N-acetylglucosaminyl 1-phosphate transferase, partial [Pirellulaceae bacterium]|nr:undecaprenyl/decaprenyl-phosphate alpha-N-acetylglucosaminyl 1-phosphate transferase [Pirellulaceae bacterium]
MWLIPATAVFGYLFCFILTPIVRKIARFLDFVDRPDGLRKTQSEPIALGGGVGVFLAACFATTLSFFLAAELPLRVFEESLADLANMAFASTYVGLALAAVLLGLLGLVDDKYGIRGVYKLLGQLVASALVVFWGQGQIFQNVGVAGFDIEIGHLGGPIAIVWLIAAINSFNLLDGADGLASSIGAIFALTIGLMAIFTGHLLAAVIAFSIAGALFAFLYYNSRPASIYLGDAGSMVIGLVLGSLALFCSVKEAAVVSFSVFFAIWAIPLLDAGAAIIRRKMTGRSVYATDRGHIHHRMLTEGLSVPQTVALITALCLITSLGSLLSVYTKTSLWSFLAIGSVLGILVVTRLFGRTELMLINRHFWSFGRHLIDSSGERKTSLQLQGSLDWESIWDKLLDGVEHFQIKRLSLNLSLPVRHEDFYASWKGAYNRRSARLWRIEIPLFAGEKIVGQFSVVGEHGGENRASTETVNEFLTFFGPIEEEISKMLRAEEAATEERSKSDDSSKDKSA